MRPTARDRAAACIADKAADWPDMPLAGPDTQGLSAADAALATAIVRATVQRWLTLRFLLERHLSKQLTRLEPAMQGVLLTGAAQVLFLQRLPDYAVVDEMVFVAKRQVRPGAAGMTNAVLRKIVRLVAGVEDQPWTPGPDRLPIDGGLVRLSEPVLPADDAVVALSCPRPLWDAWRERFGGDEAWRLAEHATRTPPTIIAVEPGFESDPRVRPHDRPGYVLWAGPGGELALFLAEHPDRRVQDPAAGVAVNATADLQPQRILDYCAGRGTKTRQLARLHPAAEVHAWDPDPHRLDDLNATAGQYPNVAILPDAEPRAAYDLIVLDVPCSNTGVLARRPEARYRYGPQSLGSLVELQRRIIDRVSPHLAAGGRLLYSTCSLDKAENHNQATRLQREADLVVCHENLETPAGTGPSYHDGAYHAMVQTRGV